MNEDILKGYYLNLKSVLKFDELFDIDVLDLFLKLRVLRKIFQEEKNSLIKILNYIKCNDLLVSLEFYLNYDSLCVINQYREFSAKNIVINEVMNELIQMLSIQDIGLAMN